MNLIIGSYLKKTGLSFKYFIEALRCLYKSEKSALPIFDYEIEEFEMCKKFDIGYEIPDDWNSDEEKIRKEFDYVVIKNDIEDFNFDELFKKYGKIKTRELQIYISTNENN